jgi:hypothetical protein
MDYEKAYREALEKIREGLQPLPDGTKISGVTRAFLEEVFPELKESEDEKIRKALVRFHKSTIDVDGIKGEEIVAWLEKQNEQKPIMNVPTREVILAIWDLGNEWKELTSGDISTEYGTQLDYIQKHWQESEYYLREKQDEKKVTTIDFNAKDWYVSKVDGKIHNINISSEKQGEKKPINPNAIKDLERAILAAHPTFKQKPTWSGEDERMVEEILDAIEAAEYEMALNMSDVRQWLKNLKQRLS